VLRSAVDRAWDGYNLRFVSRSLTTSQLYRRGNGILVRYTEFHCDYSLCELLQQENVNILAASDGGHKDDYGSFGWVIRRTEIIWDCRVLREATQCSLTVRKDTAACPLLLFLTHYIRYYGIKPQMTCVSRLTATTKAFKNEEAFHQGSGLVKLVLEVQTTT
jgi:hypothetical protein